MSDIAAHATKLTKDERIENAIIRKAIKAGLDNGCVLSVWDGGEIVVKHSSNVREIFRAMKSTGEDKLIYVRDGQRLGMVYFVYGNAGYEVINDYSCAIEDIIAPVNAYAESKEY